MGGRAGRPYGAGMRTLRRSILALAATAVLALPATADAAVSNYIATQENYSVTNNVTRSSPHWHAIAGQAGYVLWAYDGVADVRVALRDTRSDGWCARSFVEWYPRAGGVIRSKTIAGCASSWTRQFARPVSGPVPAVSSLSHIFVYRWSGPEELYRLAEPPRGDAMFCSPGQSSRGWLYPCLFNWR